MDKSAFTFDDVCVTPDCQIGLHSHQSWEVSLVMCGAGHRIIGDFCTFMRRQTGMSMSEFVNDIRLQRAMEMLHHTDKNIAEIAYDTGFANVTYFNRLFRNKYGCPPKSARLPSNPK